MEKIKRVLSKMKRKADFWSHGRKIDDTSKKHYMPGQVAKILGLENSRDVVRLIESGKIRGHRIDGKHGNARRSYWVVSERVLFEYIQEEQKESA